MSEFLSTRKIKALLAASIGCGALLLSGCGGDSKYVARMHCPPETTPELIGAGPTKYNTTYEYEDGPEVYESDALGVEVACVDADGTRFPVLGLENMSDGAIDKDGLLVIDASRPLDPDRADRYEIRNGRDSTTIHFWAADSVTAKINGQLGEFHTTN